MKCEYKEGWPQQHGNPCEQEATKTIKAGYKGFTVRLALCDDHAKLALEQLENRYATDISDTPEARHK